MYKMDLTKFDWKNITINDYKKITEIENKVKEINNDESINDVEKRYESHLLEIELIAYLTKQDKQEIENLTLNEYSELSAKLNFLTKFKLDTSGKEPKSIKFNGKTYKTNLDLQQYSISQYVSYEQIVHSQPLAIEAMLSTLLTPEDKKYGDGYDVEEFIEELGNFNFAEAQRLLYFFGKRSLYSLNNLLEQSKKMIAEIETKKKMQRV